MRRHNLTYKRGHAIRTLLAAIELRFHVPLDAEHAIPVTTHPTQRAAASRNKLGLACFAGPSRPKSGANFRRYLALAMGPQ